MDNSKLLDYLGMSGAIIDLIDVAQFLTGKTVDLDLVRHAMHEADGDPKTAVLIAYGLDTEQGRKAFDGIQAIRFYKSEDLLKAPHSIQYIAGKDISKALRQAYKVGQVSPVALGGKHSSGAYIANLDDGSYFLKPGSSKQSPAAGARENQASQSRREAAFAEVAISWGISEVKPVGLLGIDGKEVACIEMWPLDWTNLHRARMEDPNLPSRVLLPYLQRGTLHKWAILDFVLANSDRHGNNLMVGPDGHIGLIDHGSAIAGPSFDPANDDNSFVPYYLRVWSGAGWSKKTLAEKIAHMPKCSRTADQTLKEWFEGLDEQKMSATLIAYGMDPKACLDRFKQVADLIASKSFSGAVNDLWVLT